MPNPATGSVPGSPGVPIPLKTALISPWVDALCIGGGSILLIGTLLVLSQESMFIMSMEGQALLGTLLNMPHFLASYRMVYRSRETIKRYRWASIYVPLCLALYGALSLYMATKGQWFYAASMTVAGSIYLAWHYTGQTWGMMASYAYLGGTPFSEFERLLIRIGLRILLVWHVTWFLYWGNESVDERLTWVRGVIEPLYSLMSLLTMMSFACGFAGLLLFWRRTKRLPPVHVLVSWVAIYFWYAAMARDHRAIFWVQISHALQYLVFPVRVEVNVENSSGHGPGVRKHMLLYTLVLLALAFVMNYVVPAIGKQWITSIAGSESAKAVPMVLFAFLNIHHFFTDGCIWKISNPDVRRELFAHVPREKRAG